MPLETSHDFGAPQTKANRIETVRQPALETHASPAPAAPPVAPQVGPINGQVNAPGLPRYVPRGIVERELPRRHQAEATQTFQEFGRLLCDLAQTEGRGERP